MAPITRIQAPGTAQPVGHYSQAVVHGGLAYVSGQIPSDLVTGTPRAGTITEQTEISLANVRRILEAAGSGLQYALQMTIFISSIDDWPEVNATYSRIMGDVKPARAIVPVSPLHFGTAIEIMCVAAVPKKRNRRTGAAKTTQRQKAPRVRTRRRAR